MSWVKDSFYRIGHDHEVCQDFAGTSKSATDVFLCVSDGCSSSPDSDWGSRLLVSFAISNFASYAANYTKWEDMAHAILHFTHCQQINIPGIVQQSLDATLIFATTEGDNVKATMWGDGTICVVKSDGSYDVIIVDYKENTPLYLSYLLSDKRREALKTVDMTKTIRTFHYDAQGNGIDVDVVESKTDFEAFTFISPLKVFIMTDGITSFKQKVTNSNGIPVVDNYPFDKIIRELIHIPNTNGNFLKRCWGKMRQTMGKNSIYHHDDFSCAALIRTVVS